MVSHWIDQWLKWKERWRGGACNIRTIYGSIGAINTRIETINTYISSSNNIIGAVEEKPYYSNDIDGINDSIVNL